MAKVLVGMSGGVDSSLAASLAVKAGHDVSGVTMELTRKLPTDKPGFAGHGSIEDSRDAKAVADKIGIGFEVWDMSALYRDKVVNDFIKGYQDGKTPNPCVSCNQNVKFAALVAKALEKGFELVATGHYARMLREGDSDYQGSTLTELHRGLNYFKDQSYFVASMPPEVTKYCYFPLGDYYDKADVRIEAKKLGFKTHDKKDSADICFLEKGAKSQFLGAHFGSSLAGNFIDENGEVIGVHTGYWNYTIGQRKGIDIKVPRKDGEPRYVIEIRPQTKEVVVGPKALLYKTEIKANDVRIFATDIIEGDGEYLGYAQIRGHGKVIYSKIVISGEEMTVTSLNAGSGETTDDAQVAPQSDKTSVQKLPNSINDFLSADKITTHFDSVATGQSIVIYDPLYNSRVLLKATIM